jgi:hypothetical protein
MEGEFRVSSAHMPWALRLACTGHEQKWKVELTLTMCVAAWTRILLTFHLAICLMTEDSHCFWKCNWNWWGFRFLFDCLPKILADTTSSDCTHCWELGADQVSEGVVEIILCEWNSYGNDTSKEAHSCHVSCGFTGNWLTHLLPSKSYCGVLSGISSTC